MPKYERDEKLIKRLMGDGDMGEGNDFNQPKDIASELEDEGEFKAASELRKLSTAGSKFSKGVDMFYDNIADLDVESLSSSKRIALRGMKVVVEKAPDEKSFNELIKLAKKLGQRNLDTFLDDADSGEYDDEFKRRNGRNSLISGVFSMVRQAITYALET